MTSQHFDDGWDNWGEDWGANPNESNNNNNNSLQNSQQLSQSNQQYVQQQPPQMTSSAPLYSPFVYQPQGTNVSHAQTMHNPQQQQSQQQNPFAKAPNQSRPHQQPQYAANPVNFFNPTQFSDANANNNNNLSQYPTSQPPTFSFVQSPIPSSTVTTSLNSSNPQNVQFENVNNNYQYQERHESAPQNQYQERHESASQNQYQAQQPQASVSYSNDQSSALPTMPTSQPMSYSNVNQPRDVATPPTLMQNYILDSNFNSTPAPTSQQHSGYQYSQWNDQRTQSNESANWQPVPMAQNAFNQQQMPPIANQQQMPPIANQPQMPVNNNPPMPQMPPTSSDWQNLQAPQVSQQMNVSSSNQPISSSAGYFPNHFEAPAQEEKPKIQEPQVPEMPVPQIPTSNQYYQPKFDNIENIQASSLEPASIPNLPPLPPSIPQMPPLPPTSVALQQPKNPINEIPYPENRERLDDSVPTSQNNPVMPITTSSIDRHNYLVTGQLAQEVPVFSQHSVMQESFNENLPPPGLSRMVVGEPENNQEQVQSVQNDLLPPRSNRMVTGTEMTPTSFMNYQRQADGEVSHEPSMQRQLPPFNVSQQQQIPQQQERIAEDEHHQQNFNISDRNLYLVAGESDANSQRVITGVESNVPSLINPLQNLHIEDDEDFVNISVTQMSRNVDGDGMEEQNLHLQNQIQHALDSSQQREEEIEGANDNNNDLNVNLQPVIEIPSIPASVNLSEQNSDIREDIEGANELSDPPKPQPVDFEEKRKSIDNGMRTNQKLNTTLSSEDSELRELEKNMKLKSRRSNKKYDSDNDSESASLDEYKKEESRDRNDDRYSKKNRDRVREELEKYKKREKERRSGGRRRNDDTDGSRYGDSRRRTDDEDDDRRRNRNRREKRNDDEVEDDDKERERKDRRPRDVRDPRRKDYDYDDRRASRRRREKYYDDEGYPSGRRSHNASDREYERDYRPGRSSRGPYEMQGYYQQPSYPYDQNYYYQQQQQQYSDKLQAWLEQIRLTNPQAYEWYKNYYSGMLQKSQIPMQPTMDDIGGSLRSGYNSGSERASTSRFMSGGIVTNPLGSLNSSFIDNTNEYQSLQQPYQTIGKDYNQAYSSLNNFNKYDMYGDLRAKQPEVAAARLTPQKFQCLHGFVRLSNGLMITIDTLNADDKYLVKVDNVPIFDKTRRQYQSYPGPLIRGVSHKKTVIEFCEEKLKQSSHLESIERASYALLWSYLILMIRQNGSYTEHDIAELLMKNSEEYRAYDLDDNKSSANINNEIDDENATDVSESEENDASEHHSNSASHQQTSQSISASIMTEQVVLDKFKSYLLYGNIHDALDYATDNNLWGHALFLASKVDRRQHANVMLKFANKLSYNDPLQTLYQIMSGRMPACVTNFDEKWGDWRPHLAMIISNCTDKPDLVKRSILALGDTLASRGDIFGSQFCYLLIDPQFTDYSDTALVNGKIGLLGTSVQMPFKEFATDDSIIMTEVYEYARSLNTENYFIASLQKYKFLLATNMLDYGLKLKSLLYMEQISKCIIQQSQLFDSSFISKVYSLADRLKFYDPVMEKLYEDVDNVEGTEDQQWLQDLANVLQNETGTNYSQQYVPADVQTNDVYNPLDYQQQQTIQQPQSTPIYDPVSQHQTPVHAPTIPSQNYEEHDSNQIVYEQQNQVPVTTYDQNTAYSNQYQMQDQMQNYSNYNQNVGMQNDGQINEQQQNQQQGYAQQTYDPNAHGNYQQQNDGYGYGWDQPKPTITMGAALSHKFDDQQSQDKSESNANNKEDKKSPVKKAEPEKAKKQVPASGGWFSSLFRLGKAPNQMILPDDKNPAIVWDESTKKWVNKDGEEAEAESFKPPPKMGEMGMPQAPQMQNIQQAMQNIPQQQIPQQNMQQQQSMPQQQQMPQQQSMPQQQYAPQMQQPAMTQQPMMNQAPMQNHVAQMPQQQQQQQTNPNGAVDQAAPSVPSAPNMFKMQKGRNLKKSYVDILGNAGKTVSQPKELAPQMDMQFFNPAAQPQGMQFYNPNDFQ
ncbi:uncharacterized protein Sec16 isoform X2 [Chironomus tepperi]|uniref:uncharacterized protein Sec16 isoform X2 n=1 Tax=Chironomus tepperi TaxID=113505 RepID=UPI00391F204C